jgi:hypothetical protein
MESRRAEASDVLETTSVGAAASHLSLSPTLIRRTVGEFHAIWAEGRRPVRVSNLDEALPLRTPPRGERIPGQGPMFA